MTSIIGICSCLYPCEMQIQTNSNFLLQLSCKRELLYADEATSIWTEIQNGRNFSLLHLVYHLHNSEKTVTKCG